MQQSKSSTGYQPVAQRHAWHGLVARATAILVALAAGAVGGELRLVDNGRTDYVVNVVSTQRAARRGAEELKEYLQQISGAELKVTAIALPPVHEIRVTDDPSFGAEAFVIYVSEQRVIITGGRPRGVLYGCQTLLEKLGVRWLTPKVTIVPKQATITLPADLNETQTPSFEYREPYFTEAFDKDWAGHLKINGQHEHLDESTGGKMTYAHFVHTFDHLVPPKLFDTHPEYFPLIKGKRTNGYVQRCLTNPDVLKLAIEQVNRDFEKHPDATITSVSQNDTGNFCECDNCKAMVEKFGGRQSGIYLWFVNQVAEAVEKTHPDKLIDTLAYQFTEPPPKNIQPRKNVRVRLCPIAVCQGHPYDQCSFEANQAFMRHFSKWGELTDTLYIWHYNTDFAGYLQPFPDFNQFPASIRMYKKNGVKGVFFEGDYGAGGGGSDAELRSYVMAKMLWDASLDEHKLIDEWMTGVYGPAKEPMRAWFDLLHEKVRDPKLHFTCYAPPTIGYLSADVIAAGDKLFDQAEKLASGNATAAEYVAKNRLCLRYVKVAQRGKVDDEFKNFIADVKKFGIQQITEGKTVDAWATEFVKNHGAK